MVLVKDTKTIFFVLIQRDQKVATIVASGSAPCARSAHSAVVYKDSMYVFGGWDCTTSMNDFFAFNFETQEWRQIAHKGNPPPPVRSHCAVVYKNGMFTFGGFGERHPNEVYRFDFDTETWMIYCPSLSSSPPGRSRSRAITFGKKMYIFAGWDRRSYFADMYCFDFEHRSWKVVNTQFEFGIGQHSMIAFEDAIYIFGGFCSALQKPTNSLWLHVLG